MNTSKRLKLSTALAVGIASISSAKYAQEFNPEDAGITYTFDVTNSLRINDNISFSNPSLGNVYLFDTTVGLGYENITPISRLAVDVDGTLRFADTPLVGSEIKFDDPDFGIEYERFGARTDVGLEAIVSVDDLQFSDPLREAEQLIENPLVTDTGFIENRTLKLFYLTGKDTAFGASLEGQHNKILYNDTTDARLTNSETNNIDGSLRFTVSPVVELRAIGNFEKYRTEIGDGETRETTTYGAEFDYNFSPIWTLTAGIYDTTVSTIDLGTNAEELVEGATGRIAVIREFPDGVFEIGYDSIISTTGRRETIEVSRMTMNTRYDFSWSLGGTRGASGDTNVIGSLGYRARLATSDFSVNLEREFGTSVLGNEIERNRFDMSYIYNINDFAGIEFGLNYSSVGDANNSNAITETSRGEATLAYRQTLAENFGIRVGVRHIENKDEAFGDADANEIFFESVYTLIRKQ